MIRTTRTEDWQLLRDVRLRALQEAPYAFLMTYAESAAFPDEHWQERATSGDRATTFVLEADARFDGIVTGFADEEAATVYLVGMWVAPERRGTGAAQQLVESVVEWARGRGATRVLLAVEAGNERAARLYERCGFVRLAEQPQLPWDSDSPAYELRL
ncbi:MAG: GNAT family N-acetyltransferase [Gaiellaceae bacterium]